MLTYSQLEIESIREVERRMLRRFIGRDRGRMKCATAHVLQSIRRHGTGNPLFLKREVSRSVAAALGIWEILLPVFIPFLKQAIALLVEQLIKLIDGLQPTDQTTNPARFRSAMLMDLADEAAARWPQKGQA